MVASAYIPTKNDTEDLTKQKYSKILKPGLWLLKEILGGEIHWGVEMDTYHYYV